MRPPEIAVAAVGPTPYEAHVQRLVASAPALTTEQRARLRVLFRGLPHRAAA